MRAFAAKRAEGVYPALPAGPEGFHGRKDVTTLISARSKEEVPVRGVVMYTGGDVRVEERADPKIIEPTDAIIRLTATCICGSDLWPYRVSNPPTTR